MTPVSKAVLLAFEAGSTRAFIPANGRSKLIRKLSHAAPTRAVQGAGDNVWKSISDVGKYGLVSVATLVRSAVVQRLMPEKDVKEPIGEGVAAMLGLASRPALRRLNTSLSSKIDAVNASLSSSSKSEIESLNTSLSSRFDALNTRLSSIASSLETLLYQPTRTSSSFAPVERQVLAQGGVRGIRRAQR
jgi:hypothetical protein